MKLLFLSLVILIPMLSEGAEVATSFVSAKTFHQELYSESTYYQKYDVVTEGRVRSYASLWGGENWIVEPFLGVTLQYQSPGAELKYFDNTATPALGIQARFFQKITLQAQGGVRTVISDTENENAKSEWDPRIILSAGDFWGWQSWGAPAVFTEAYGESAYVSRLSSTPVTTFWLKQGYRFKVASQVYVDPYAEFFLRESRSADLGPSITQGRAGVRALWATSSWTVAGLLYHNLKQNDGSAPLEGLFVVGGNF